MIRGSFIRRERQLWHKHFIPSFIAGILVAIVSFAFEITVSSIVLFASVGASAIILTNTRSHHLTSLRTAIVAYVIAIVISSLVYITNSVFPLHISVNLFLIVFLVSILLFLSNAFHPPAITASLSFILLQRPLVDLFYLFVAVIVLLILARLATYTFSQHLSLKEFAKELRKSF